MDRCWKELQQLRQGDESFHRYSSRVLKTVIAWAKLAIARDHVAPDVSGHLALSLVKQFALEGVSDGLKAFMKQKKPR